jgi:hypothetical protein
MTNIPAQGLIYGVFQRKGRFVAIYSSANLPQIVKVSPLQKGNQTAKHAKTAKKEKNHEHFFKKTLSEDLNS